jgi:hypothetical protein
MNLQPTVPVAGSQAAADKAVFAAAARGLRRVVGANLPQAVAGADGTQAAADDNTPVAGAAR